MPKKLVEILFRNLRSSAVARQKIIERVNKLHRFHPRIMRCRVTVHAPRHRQIKGRIYHVGIDARIPGRAIVVNHDRPPDAARHDLYVAIHEAFNALERRLEDAGRRRRGDVKTHAPDSAMPA